MTTQHPPGSWEISPGAGKLTVRQLSIADAEAKPLLDGLAAEYTTRYGPNDELTRFPPSEFAPPHGAFVLVFADDRAVAGGAFRRLDEQTAELKRMWTDGRFRRRGLARLVVTELEREAARRGYRRIFLTTGPRQPEAEALYLAAGYRPEYDLGADRQLLGFLPFTKELDGVR